MSYRPFGGVYKKGGLLTTFYIYCYLLCECFEWFFDVHFIISKSENRAESNGIGLKTCKKLGEYINAGFEFVIDKNIFTATLKLKLDRK